ncbi:MAG: hypothetical protein US13_C0016G0018, partial [candidate division TM6 bacterium GW2011_GWE2_36_25]
ISFNLQKIILASGALSQISKLLYLGH